MSHALPPAPPEHDFEMAVAGFQAGVLYGVASAFLLGWFAIVFPVLGALIGWTVDSYATD